MSTGENINANGAVLTSAILRMGFRLFPQSTTAYVNPGQWPQIAPIQTSEGYPFKAFESDLVPTGQVWFIGATGETLGRIINIGNPIETI